MSPVPPPGDKARVTVTVAVNAEVAFDVFTKEIDLWWRKGPRFRRTPRASRGVGVLHFEPGVGGRLFESFGEGSPLVEMGRVTLWEPPHRLGFDWRNETFADEESTHVTVEFREIDGKTEVTVTHSGWASLRDDHPAKHGMDARAFARSLGSFWGDLMSALREHTLEHQA